MIALDESRYGDLARNPRTLRFCLPFSSPFLCSALLSPLIVSSHRLSRSDQPLRYLPSYARSQRVGYGAGTYSSWEDQRLALMQGQVEHEGGEGGRLIRPQMMRMALQREMAREKFNRHGAWLSSFREQVQSLDWILNMTACCSLARNLLRRLQLGLD